MINEKVIKALESLNIPTYWIEYNGNEDSYILFQTLDVLDTNFSDDMAEDEVTYMSLNYWFKNQIDAGNINKIKALLKENGFIKMNEKDLKDADYYGRSFRFKYIEPLI